jgi:hypothetical protein
MREVGDLQYAEDEGEPCGNQEQQRADDQSRGGLGHHA